MKSKKQESHVKNRRLDGYVKLNIEKRTKTFRIPVCVNACGSRKCVKIYVLSL